MGAILRKYNTATTIVFPLVDFGQNDFEATPVTHASGDTQISKDEGAFANTSNAFAHEGKGMYSIALTATEMSAARIMVIVIDQSNPKLWEDQAILIETYGNASAQHPFDLGDADPSVDVVKWNGTAPNNLSSGRVDATVGAMQADVVTASSIAASAIGASEIATGAIDADALAADLNTYQAQVDLIDDDGGTTDRYVVVFHKNSEVVSAGSITSPTIQVIKVADGSDLVASTALTQVTGHNAFHKAEGTNRVVDGVAYVIKLSATIDSASRTWYKPIGRDS